MRVISALIFLLIELQNATTKGGEEMLLNLKTEIARKRLSATKIAEYIGITPKTMSCKVNEKTEFTRSEMFAIHSRFFPMQICATCFIRKMTK